METKGAIMSLYEIKNFVLSLGVDWSEQSEGDEACFVKLSTSGQSQSIVTHSITFAPDLRWKLYVHRQEVVKDRCSYSRKLHLPSKRKLISQVFLRYSPVQTSVQGTQMTNLSRC